MTHDAGDSDGGRDEDSALTRYCSSAAAYVDRCGAELDDCDRAVLVACSETSEVERDEFLEARAACGFPDECGELATYEERLCVYEATASVEPTAAQMALAEALCTRCERGPDCLDNFFYRAPPSENGPGGISGIGASFLHLQDTLVEQLQRDCLPEMGAASCFQAFLTCLEETIEARWPESVTMACTMDDPS